LLNELISHLLHTPNFTLFWADWQYIAFFFIDYITEMVTMVLITERFVEGLKMIKKSVLVLRLSLFVLMPCVAEAAPDITFTSDGIINSDYNYVFIRDGASVDMVAGTVSQMRIYNNSTLNFYDNVIASLRSYNTSIVNAFGGEIGGGSGAHHPKDSSTWNIYDGARVNLIYPDYTSVLNVYGGTMRGIHAKGLSTTNIYGGLIDTPKVYDDSIMNIYGGEFDSRYDLYACENGRVHLYGTDFLYDDTNGIVVSGLWNDGTAFVTNVYDTGSYQRIVFHGGARPVGSPDLLPPDSYVIPAPPAILLGFIGVGCVHLFRRKIIL
jgi:hypothetical protein